jgi:aminoglycoside 3-N-acetyltransferase
MLNYKELVKGFKELGIKVGDIVFVHSSYKSFGGVEGGPRTVIDALLNVLGKNGTLIMPTFTLDFCNQYNKYGIGFFNVNNSPSEMGILTELVRKMSGAKRTINPIYSVAVYGKLTDSLSTVCDKNVYGKNSIFGKLHELNAKIMIIGLDYQNSFTFFHYVEEMMNIDYRNHKRFSGFIITDNGFYFDNFIMRVRNKNISTAVNPMGKKFEERGIVTIKKIGESIVKNVCAKDAYDVTVQEMKKNPKLLYKIKS